MLVILKENVDNLGTIGDLIKVSDGYARNYLLPRNLVVVADEGKVNELEHHKRILEKKRAAFKKSVEDIAKNLSGFSCNIKRKVGKNGKLFGSVTTADIAEGLKAGGFDIAKTAIRIDQPIKELGAHTVEVKLHPEVTAPLKVYVVQEE